MLTVHSLLNVKCEKLDDFGKKSHKIIRLYNIHGYITPRSVGDSLMQEDKITFLK